jgi:integrase/recombinase XerD
MPALTLQHPEPPSHDPDIRKLIVTWQHSLELQALAGEISANTQQAYMRGFNRFLDWADDLYLESVSADVLRAWIADLRRRGYRPASVNAWLAGVRAFFAWAVASRRLSTDPTLGLHGVMRRGASRRHSRSALTDQEVLRVLALPDRTKPRGCRDFALLCLMAYTAARQIELNRADLSDLRTVSGHLVLNVQGKGREEKDEVLVLANPEVENAVHDWLAHRGQQPGPLFTSLSRRSPGERLSLRSIRRLVKNYYLLAGVRGDDKTTHSLRHSAITSAVRHGAPVQKVRSMARHASIDTTMIYFHEVDRVENPAEAFIKYGEEEIHHEHP